MPFIDFERSPFQIAAITSGGLYGEWNSRYHFLLPLNQRINIRTASQAWVLKLDDIVLPVTNRADFKTTCRFVKHNKSTS
jgi:hypothetical protein